MFTISLLKFWTQEERLDKHKFSLKDLFDSMIYNHLFTSDFSQVT